MPARKYTIVRDMDPDLVDAEYRTDDPEEADELLEMAHARRPWARVTIYDGAEAGCLEIDESYRYLMPERFHYPCLICELRYQ